MFNRKTEWFNDRPGRLLPDSVTMNATAEPMVERSWLYREFLAGREERLRHKWSESEKDGAEIGFEAALVSWGCITGPGSGGNAGEALLDKKIATRSQLVKKR